MSVSLGNSASLRAVFSLSDIPLSSFPCGALDAVYVLWGSSRGDFVMVVESILELFTGHCSSLYLLWVASLILLSNDLTA